MEQRHPDARGDIHEPLRALTGPRRVIVHYHLFKNAGKSVDRMLRENS